MHPSKQLMKTFTIITICLSLFALLVVVRHGSQGDTEYRTVRPSLMIYWPESPKLDGSMSSLAGRTVRVRCYRDSMAWDVRAQSAGYPDGQYVDALTYRGSADTEVSPQRCRALYYALRVGASKANLAPLGYSLNVLAHEAQHLRGIETERVAEACGRKAIALLTHLAYGVQYHTPVMRQIVNAGLTYTSVKPPAYQGGTCDR